MCFSSFLAFFTNSQPGPSFIILFVQYSQSPGPSFEPGTGVSSGKEGGSERNKFCFNVQPLKMFLESKKVAHLR